MTALQRFIDDELRAARGWTTRLLSDLARAVGEPHGGPLAAAGSEAQRALAAGQQQVQAQWILALQRLMAPEGAAAKPKVPAGLPAELALVDDDQAQEDIEMMRIVQLVELRAEASLRELQALGAALQGHDDIGPQSNPLRPDRVARALREGLATLALARPARLLLLHRSAALLAATLCEVYAASVDRLESQGVTPMAYRTMRLGVWAPMRSATGSERAAADASRTGGRDADVTRLFERMRADRRIHEPVRAALARLQAPAERVARQDPAMVDTLQHPTWRLVNTIAMQAAGYEQADDARLQDWLRAVDAALDQAGVPDPQGHHHAHALRSLESKAAAMLEAERADAADVIERLNGLARRDQLRLLHQARVARQLADAALSAELRQFLLETWSEVLAAAVMRYGEDARQVLALQAVVPGLLRSLQAPPPGADAATLARDNDRLCQWIGKGLSMIGWPEAHRQTAAAHIAALQARAARAAPDAARLSPEELVRRLRDEDESGDAPPRDPGPVSLIDVANLDTLPTPLAPDAGDRPSTAWLRQLAPGLWCTGFVRARWRSLRLIWVSADGGYLMFAGSPPGRRFSLKRAALDRLAAEGLFKLLEPRNAVERALDALAA